MANLRGFDLLWVWQILFKICQTPMNSMGENIVLGTTVQFLLANKKTTVKKDMGT